MKDDFRDLFIGVNEEIKLSKGNKVLPINFDNAATTPSFKENLKAIEYMLNLYSSIGRGIGYRENFCNEFYENSKSKILDFFRVKNKEKYTAIYVKNATEGLNLLGKALSDKKNYVISTRMEHHANDLPWREYGNVLYIEVDNLGRLKKEEIEESIKRYKGRVKYLTITGASNVTGYLNPIYEIAKIAHDNNIKIIVDGAQLVSHREINIEGTGKGDNIDFLVFSAHKIYAPFGLGVVIALKEEIEKKEPLLRGGGAVDLVSDSKVFLDTEPERFEAGTQNLIGVCALLSSLRIIKNIGFEKIKAKEERLKNLLIKGLEDINKVILYGDSNYEERTGVVVFNIEGIYHEDMAKRLADFRGISIRNGSFCAHPYVRRLLNLKEEEFLKYAYKDLKRPGMLRASLGLYNTESEVYEFLNCIELLKDKDFKI